MKKQSEYYDVYCDFDIKKHKNKYVNYLEVVIAPDGTIMYAVPSHQEKAISEACKKLNLTRKELSEMCPPEYYGDFLWWLANVSGLVFVWDFGVVYDVVTREQITALEILKKEGLYKGEIPVIIDKLGEKQKNG